MQLKHITPLETLPLLERAAENSKNYLKLFRISAKEAIYNSHEIIGPLIAPPLRPQQV